MSELKHEYGNIDPGQVIHAARMMNQAEIHRSLASQYQKKATLMIAEEKTRKCADKNKGIKHMAKYTHVTHREINDMI